MRRLVLIGGGHAHLEVLRQAAARRFAGAELVLISPYAHHHYSGMVPGFLQGTYAEPDLAFDLPALCRAAGARFHEASAERVDPAGRWVDVGGARVECDLVSADVGSAPAGVDDVPGAREHAFTVRPMTRAVALERSLGAAIASAGSAGAAGTRGRDVAVCVVGGGAAGVEVSLAVQRRLDAAGCRAGVTLVDRSPTLLADYAPAIRRTVERLFTARGIGARTGCAVARVTPDAVVLDTGEPVASTLTIWLTGAAPTALTVASDLPKDERGFWLVDETLRSVGGGAVWGGGDCIGVRGHPWVSKAGVYAVRQGPVLAANLRIAVEAEPGVTGSRYARYVPQPHFLAILNTADGRALLRWHGLTAHARAAWWLKDAIDRRFMAKYRVAGTAAMALPAAREPDHGDRGGAMTAPVGGSLLVRVWCPGMIAALGAALVIAMGVATGARWLHARQAPPRQAAATSPSSGEARGTAGHAVGDTREQLAEDAWTTSVAGLRAAEAGAVTVIDVRSARDYRRGHVPGAMRVSWLDHRDGWGRTGKLPEDLHRVARAMAALGVDSARPVVVYGAARDGWGEEGRVAWMLHYLGHPRVTVLDGGWPAWQRAGGPAVRDDPEPRAGRFVARPRVEARASADDVARAPAAGVAILDTRSAAEWNGSRRYWPERTGRIPGAVHLEWRELLTPEGLIDRSPALRARLRTLGLTPERPVIAYCVGGVRSGEAFVVLRALGFRDVRNYDGSWYEWAADKRRPVVNGADDHAAAR